jgi:hypothetical protein
MRSRRLASVVASAAVTGAVVLGGCGLAAPKTKTPKAGGVATGAAAASTQTAGGVVHLTDYSNSDGATSTAILTGAIGDFGKAVSVYPNGAVDPQHDSQLNLALAHGSFRLSIADLDKQLVSAFRRFPSNTDTCSGTVTTTGAVPIVAGSGAGAYRGVSGAFTLTVTVDEVVPRSACSASGAFLAEAIVMTGPGTIAVR